MLERKNQRASLTRRKLLLAAAGLALPPVDAFAVEAVAPRKQVAPAPKQPAPPSADARPWLTLPATPTLPPARNEGRVDLNGTNIFFAQFGDGPHVLLLHGGLANSNYWGHQVRALAPDFLVTVMDTRGHGRSPVASGQFSYLQFAQDVVALLKHLGITRSAVVGWSDGGITGIQLAMIKPELMSGLFAFGANTNLGGLIANGASSAVFQKFSERCRQEYRALSPRPENWPTLKSGLVTMWRSQPTFTRAQLSAIKVPTAVSDGEYDEIEHTRKIAAEIPNARLVIMPKLSHFALLQDSARFNAPLLDFLRGISR